MASRYRDATCKKGQMLFQGLSPPMARALPLKIGTSACPARPLDGEATSAEQVAKGLGCRRFAIATFGARHMLRCDDATSGKWV